MIGTFLSNLLGPNWRTSFIGLVSGIAALLGVLSQQGVHIPAWLVGTAGFIAAGGFAAIGFAAKDAQVTGGTVAQPTPAAVAAQTAAPKPPSPAPPGTAGRW